MKIVKEGDNSIVLKENLLWVIVIGILFLVLGVLILANIIKIEPLTQKLFIGIAASILGILVIIFSSNRTIDIDRMQETLIIKDKTLFKNNTQKYSFKDIKSLDLVWSIETTGNKKKRKVLRCLLFLVLKNGKEIQFSRGMMAQNTKYKEIGTKISSLTGIPYIERTPPELPKKSKFSINGLGG